MRQPSRQQPSTRDAEMTTNPTVGEQRHDDMRRQGGRFNRPARRQESHPRFDAMKVRSCRMASAEPQMWDRPIVMVSSVSHGRKGGGMSWRLCTARILQTGSRLTLLLDRPSRSASPSTIRQESPELTDRLSVRFGSIVFGGSSGALLDGRACWFESTARDESCP